MQTNLGQQNQHQLSQQPSKKLKTIGEYQIGRTIGTGTFGSVREAIHQRTGQKVSVKILNKSLIVQAKDKINLSRELRILKKVRHPNIAQLLQTMETSTRVYFVMEVAENGELFNVITGSNKGRLSEGFASLVFQQLINAVEYLHSIGIAHRDIKPENILLDHQNNVKLIDFGLSSFYQKDQQLLTACGSPCYAAPQMLVEQSYDPLTADLWSCGIVLYAMICGFLPFQDKSTKVLYNLIKQGKYEEPKHMSLIVKDLLSKILKLNPRERISIAEMRKHPFCLPKQPVIRGLLPSQTLKLDQEIIEQMNNLGYYAFKGDIENHRNSPNTSAYYLLLYRKLRNQRKMSLMTYFQKMQEEEKIKSPYRSKSLVLKRNVSELMRKVGDQVPTNCKLNNAATTKKLRKKSLSGGSNPLIALPTSIVSRYGQNEEQGDFLDQIFKKNVTKMKQKVAAMNIRIRKVTS